MSRPPALRGGQTLGFPRVSGDEPHLTHPKGDRDEFSPRERG